MVRPPYYDSSTGIKKGAWSEDEDFKLRSHINQFGHSNWRLVPILAGLARCGKSCRLRWVNYLNPDLKRGNFTTQEEDLIIQLHAKLGNKWSSIAKHLPGRTDNEVKNHWHAHLKKRRSRPHRAAGVLPRDQSSETTSSCTTSSHDDHHQQQNDVFSTSTKPQDMNLVKQIPHPHYYEVDPFFTTTTTTTTTSTAGATNQVHFNYDVIQFEDDMDQIFWDMDTLLCTELLMQNSVKNDSMNNCTGYASDATGVTSSAAESLDSEALLYGVDGQYYDPMLWLLGDD